MTTSSAINIDAITSNDLGISKMTKKDAQTACINWAAEAIATFWASSVADANEKLAYANTIITGQLLLVVVTHEVSLINIDAYRSVYPAVKYK